MIGFRKKSRPAMAPAGLPWLRMISVAVLAVRRTFTWRLAQNDGRYSQENSESANRARLVTASLFNWCAPGGTNCP